MSLGTEEFEPKHRGGSAGRWGTVEESRAQHRQRSGSYPCMGLIQSKVFCPVCAPRAYARHGAKHRGTDA